MKKIIVSSIVSMMLTSPVVLFAQQGNAFTLKGKVGNLNASLKIYLAKALNPKAIIDSATVKDGSFEIKGTLKEPSYVLLVAATSSSGVATSTREKKIPFPDLKGFYLDFGQTMVSSPDTLRNIVVSGASEKLNKESAEAYKALQPAFNAEGAVGQFQMKASEEEQKTDAYKKAVNAKIDSADAYMRSIVIAFVKAHPNSMISLAEIKGHMMGASFENLKDAFNLLSEEVKNTPSGKAYAQGLANEEKTAIGYFAPDFASKDVNGKSIKLSDFKGKYVLVDFWASWCVPCRKENPNVVKAYQKYKDKNFTIISISFDKTKEPWLQAIEKDQLTWTNVCDFNEFGGDAAVKYNVKAIPTNFLIDPQGKIIGKSLRDVQLEEALAKFVK
jgi:peroxiredoxin